MMLQSDDGSDFIYQIPLKNFDACWAGPSHLSNRFVFGSEDGQFIITEEDGGQQTLPDKGSLSGEAINGIAGVGRWFAVSTRFDVSCWTLPNTPDGPLKVAVFPHGAHGIAVTQDGCFVAPGGRTGIIVVYPSLADTTSIHAIGTLADDMAFYSLSPLHGSKSQSLVVWAAGSRGLGVLDYRQQQSDGGVFNAMSSPDVDVVDICSLGQGAVLAVSIDGVLVFLRDILQDTNPLMMSFDEIQGTVYRVLCCQGHVFLLTNIGLYVLGNLASQLLSGNFIVGGPVSAIFIKGSAVDMNVCWGKWLLVVLSNTVLRLDVDKIHAGISSNPGDRQIQPSKTVMTQSKWENRKVNRRVLTREVAAV